MKTDNTLHALDGESLAERWDMKRSTLDNWRSLGKGPVFTKIGGKVIYLIDDVIAYEQGARRRSTSSEGIAA